MVGILDNALMAGLETTYGAAAPITSGVEATGHSYKLRRPVRTSTYPRPGAHGEQADRNIIMNHGGEGQFVTDIYTKGHGFWMQALLGTVAGPTETDQAGVYETIAETAVDAPTQSFTIQGLQHDVSNNSRVATHLGAIVYKWSLEHAVTQNNLMLTADWMSQNVVTDVDAGTPQYPDGALPYDGESNVGMVTLDGGNPRCVRSWKLTADLGFLELRKCLDGTGLVKRPIRTKFPTYTLEVDLEWNGDDLLDKYAAGENIPVSILYTGDELADGVAESWALDAPSMLLTEDPFEVKSPTDGDDVGMLKLRGMIQHDQSIAEPMIRMTYVSTDNAL